MGTETVDLIVSDLRRHGYLSHYGPESAKAADIIARHLGAGQPVAADRAALVERMAVASHAMGKVVWDAQPPCTKAIHRAEAERFVSAVEAAGWGPRTAPVAGTGETLYRKCKRCDGNGGWPGVKRERVHCDDCDGEGYVPVAPPEPLSAGEIDKMIRAVAAEWDLEPGSRCEASVFAVLAALPARFPVPVEGA